MALLDKYILFAGLNGLGARKGVGGGGGGAGPVGSHARRLGTAAGSYARLRKVVSVQPPLARTCAYVKLPRCSRNYLSTQDQLSGPQVLYYFIYNSQCKYLG